jgi:hypothetical protein
MGFGLATGEPSASSLAAHDRGDAGEDHAQRAAGAGGSAQMTAPVVFEIQSLADLEHITDSVGQVGPRTGRAKRTKEQMEWFVLSRFLEKAIPNGIFKLPIAGRNGSRGREEPDFVLMRAGTNDVIALVEITEATNEADQREMKEFERSGERMALLGHSGGRFPRGAARPGLAWASDIIDAIKRKETKVIFKSSLTSRHLIIYPNSNASKLLGDQLGQEGQNEREAIGHLRQAIDIAGNLARVTNGCHVHVLGMRHICVDVVGDMKVLHR